MNSQGNTITGLQHGTAALEVLVNLNSISAFKSHLLKIQSKEQNLQFDYFKPVCILSRKIRVIQDKVLTHLQATN